MAESRNSEALILRRNDWRENDSRVVLYTKNFGKLSLAARGTKKTGSKIAGHIEPISLVDIMILKGKSSDYLASAICREPFLNIKGNLNSLYFVGSALSLFDRLVKEEAPDKELFAFLFDWLVTVESCSDKALDKDDGELLYDYFAVRLLTILGYKPELYHCLSCHQKTVSGTNYFNLRLGGLICSDCLSLNRQKYLPNELPLVSDDVIKLLRIFSEAEKYSVIKAKSETIKELSRLVKLLIEFI